MNTTSATRAVARIIPAIATVEGGGFPINRPFPIQGIPHLDPFLLLDEAGPVEWAPGQAIGAPDHPHRGFETVTYSLAGGGHHRDSSGYEGTMRPGDAQWMTAGRGVVHAEMPSDELLANGGRFHGFQIWVNLPAARKMIPPRYQDIPQSRIARRERDGAIVRVIAGEVDGLRGPVETNTPVTLAHLTLERGARVRVDAPETHTALAYVFGGAVDAGGRTVAPSHLMQFGGGCDAFDLAGAGEDASEVLVLTGAPLGEPVARYGPFVMNTIAELEQAFDDFQHGRMGSIAPRIG